MPQYPLPHGLVQLSSLEVSAEQRQTLEEGRTSAETEAADVRTSPRRPLAITKPSDPLAGPHLGQV